MQSTMKVFVATVILFICLAQSFAERDQHVLRGRTLFDDTHPIDWFNKTDVLMKLLNYTLGGACKEKMFECADSDCLGCTNSGGELRWSSNDTEKNRTKGDEYWGGGGGGGWDAGNSDGFGMWMLGYRYNCTEVYDGLRSFWSCTDNGDEALFCEMMDTCWGKWDW